jgi:uncharacterized membrane protein (DUF4010 family)
MPEFDPDSPAVRLAVAALVGLTIGLEREWSVRSRGLSERFAGVRTFVLVGLIGGLAAQLSSDGHLPLGAILVAGVAAIAGISYAAAAKRGEVDGTTEVASLVVLGAAILAGAGHLELASGIGAVTALLLFAKGRIHALVERIRSEEIEAGIRFAVLAVVVLPLLPEGPFGPPPGFRPRELWALVLLFAGLSFLGHVALRAVGARRGYGIAGLLGGLVSSTLATLNFSRESRSSPALGRSLALGTVAACTITPIRVLVLTFAISRAVGVPALRYLLPSFAAGAATCLILLLRRDSSGKEKGAKIEPAKQPLRLWVAIQMAAGFQIVLYLVSWATSRLGEMGTLGSAAIVGATDVDALIYTMARLSDARLTAEIAARALGVGLLSNTALKLGISLVVGRGSYRLLAGGSLLLLGLALVVPLLIF